MRLLSKIGKDRHVNVRARSHAAHVARRLEHCNPIQT